MDPLASGRRLVEKPGCAVVELGTYGMEKRLFDAIAGLREEEALSVVEEMMATGADALRIVEVARRGMDEVGRRYQRREYYLSGLIMSGEIFKEIMERLDQKLGDVREGAHGREVILGTPMGDVHDIGKNIVASLLRCSGFGVTDLGVNVAPSRFVQAAAESGATVVGMSALITPAFEAMRETVWCFERAGLRGRVRIMIGGGAVTEKVCGFVGADAWSRDAADATVFAEAFYGMES